MIKTRILPQDGDTCGWLNTHPAVGNARVLSGSQSVDWVVVGGGFTGLACARRLAELRPNDRIAVLEAQRVGQGNSGRNSGFLLDLSLMDQFTPDISAAATRLQKAGLARLRALVEQHSIDCDWRESGALYGAISPQELPYLRKLEQRFLALDEPIEQVSAARMTDINGSTKYLKGIHHPGPAMVQPAALVQGLANSLPANVLVYENSPVQAMERDGGWRLSTPAGFASAPKVMLCNNGFLPEMGIGTNRVVHVATFGAMSHKLNDQQLGQLGGETPFGIMSTLREGPTVRKTADRRFFVRDAYCYLPEKQWTQKILDRAEDHLRRVVAVRWPGLEDIELPHIWGGVTNLARNDGQLFGKVETGLYVSGICNGSHNTKGSMAGILLAENALGIESDLLSDQLKIPKPNWLPPGPLLRLIVEFLIGRSRRKAQAIYGI